MLPHKTNSNSSDEWDIHRTSVSSDTTIPSGLDSVVNNAGIMLNGDILTTTEEQFDRGPTQLKKFKLEF